MRKSILLECEDFRDVVDLIFERQARDQQYTVGMVSDGTPDTKSRPPTTPGRGAGDPATAER